MNRARSLGWNDTYTFTKWIGEQLLLRDRGDVPLVIFRPAFANARQRFMRRLGNTWGSTRINIATWQA